MPKISGKYLNDKWQIGAKHALYRYDGKWYHHLKDFPGALFDANGYIVFESEDAYLTCEYLQHAQDLHIPVGISSIPGYVLIQQTTYERVKEDSPNYSSRGDGDNRIDSTIPPTAIASDTDEDQDPNRILTTTYRILRDTQLSRVIKELYQYQCQVCGLCLQLKSGQRYAEAHHIRPLGSPHHGPDIMENIICVCPNHHAQLDYGAIKLDRDKLRIIPGHHLSNNFIDYHNLVIAS